MKHGRLILDRKDNGFTLVDTDGGVSLQLSRVDARFLFSWLMQRLNVKEATLTDGRKVTGFYEYEKVLETINELEKSESDTKPDPELVRGLANDIEAVAIASGDLEPSDLATSEPKPDTGKKHKGSSHRN